MRKALIICSLMGLMACSSPPLPKPVIDTRAEIIDREVPGTVHSAYVEPIIDTVKVPTQLDPEGNYLRPSHTSVYEIRPGRVQPVEFPPDNRESEKKSGQE